MPLENTSTNIDDDTEYEVIIRLRSKGLSGELHLSLEITPEGTEERFRDVQSSPGDVPSVLMAANSIIHFIESGMNDPEERLVAEVTKNVVN
jgi:hypothetical protein